MKVLIVLNPVREISFRDSWYSSSNPARLFDNIGNLAKKMDRVLITKDQHTSEDNEFKFLPKHCLASNFGDMYEHDFLNQLDPNKRYFLKTKETLSALHFNSQREFFSEHLTPNDDIVIGGFALSLDIIPTVLDLLQEGYNKVRTYEDIVDDISPEYKEISLKYLQIIGVLDG